jgi:hypothetical protein
MKRKVRKVLIQKGRGKINNHFFLKKIFLQNYQVSYNFAETSGSKEEKRQLLWLQYCCKKNKNKK